MIKDNLFDKELHSNLIDNHKDELDDSTFNLWKMELKKELPKFWKSMDEPIKPRRRFSHSL